MPAVPDGGLLGAPTMRPGEPVTHGLTSGPGAGPEVLGNMAPNLSQIGDFYRKLSAATGDPYFAELAQRANL